MCLLQQNAMRNEWGLVGMGKKTKKNGLIAYKQHTELSVDLNAFLAQASDMATLPNNCLYNRYCSAGL